MYGKKKQASGRRYRRTAALLGALVLSAVSAWRPVSAAAVDLTGSCSLQIVMGQEAPAGVRPQLAIDLYQVASAVPVEDGSTGAVYDSYALKALEGFTGLQEELDTLWNGGEGEKQEGEAHGGDYRRLAVSASKSALGIKGELREGEAVVSEGAMAPVRSIKPGEKAEDLSPGLYLAVARGRSLESVESYALATSEGGIATAAYGRESVYRYAPELIALPQREEAGTAGSEEAWVYEVEAVLKEEKGDRYASLRIIKNTEPGEQAGEERLTRADHFVYQIEAELGGRNVYSSAVMVTLEEGEQTAERVLGNIVPPGARITVTEVYAGASHELSEGQEGSVTIEQAAPDPDAGTPGNEAVFYNTHTGTDTGGGAIENRFEYKGKEDGSGEKAWSWTPAPGEAEIRDAETGHGTETP